MFSNTPKCSICNKAKSGFMSFPIYTKDGYEVCNECLSKSNISVTQVNNYTLEEIINLINNKYQNHE